MEELDDDVPVSRMSRVCFRLYSAKDIKSLSVKEITNPQTFDHLQHPTTGGLHDAALGPSERNDVCTTCGQNSVFCPGHMGHIELPLPVFNPIYFKTLYRILRGSCLNCHRLYAKASASQLLIRQINMLNRGDITAVWLVADFALQLLAKSLDSKDIDIAEQLDTFIQDNFSGKDFTDRNPVKNIEAARKVIIEDFMKTNFGTKAKCTHCKCRTRTLRQEYNAKLLLFGSSQSVQQVLQEAKKKIEMKKKSLDVTGDTQEEDVEVIEMDQDNSSQGDQASSKQKSSMLSLHVDVTMVTPVDAREHMRSLWEKESAVLKMLFQCLSSTQNIEHPTDIFFHDIIPVPPPRFRPLSVMNDRRYENSQTANLCKLLEDSQVIKQILREISKANQKESSDVPPDSLDSVSGETLTQKLQFAWSSLQAHMNCVIDSSLDKISKDKQQGIKQLLEKKEGLFRKHMMGKRVNFAARSVISPDPCIDTNEIGVPEVFAKKLTYPQPVTPWNFLELQQAVINGPLKHPGATMVINEKGVTTRLSETNRVQREAIAKTLLTPTVSSSYLLKPKTVLRHLKNGDYLLLNRQPSLHKASMQAHRARVLKGQKTLRMHYSNCKAYNADFDGDEMNAHFPQSELARAEAAIISCTDNQYLVPKDGTPLAGLIQDHMVSGVWLTVRGTFFDRMDYCQLLYACLPENHALVKDIPPAIIKPCRLWSGKQLVSSLLLNIIPEGSPLINMDGKSKIPEKSWQQPGKLRVHQVWPNPDVMGESVVIIRGGQLLQGVLDKGHYGPTPYGLVHCCYEMYGGEVAGKLITSLGKLFRAYLQIRGFTLGVEDILVTKHANKMRKNFIAASPDCATDVVVKALNVDPDLSDSDMVQKLREAHLSRDDREMRELDLAMKSKTDEIQNNITKACMPLGLHKPFPYNNLQLMVQSGAKGSTVNCMQISSLLGQIELEGRRPPLMMGGRALPSFLPYDPTPRAGGFVTGRFLTGIRPPEYFFHCMAGREGLIDTAVKTSRSGYLQRCLVKHLEGLMVNYDLSVRDSDGSVVQFYYGEDGLDVSKTPFLSPKQFPFLVWNRNALNEITLSDEPAYRKTIKKLNKKISSWKKKASRRNDGSRQSGFLKFCREQAEHIADVDRQTIVDGTGRIKAAKTLQTAWSSLSEGEKLKYEKHSHRCPDPVMSKYKPSEHPGVISEKIPELLTELDENSFTKILEGCPSNTVEDFGVRDFKNMLTGKVLRSMAEPGEAVGLLCAQSIGEPSTQMTLNTFHFAGRGEMNVTLGIPRLREIIMVASAKLKTPSMEIAVRDTSSALYEAKKLQKKLNKVVLSQVLRDVEVCEMLSIDEKSKYNRYRKFRVKFNFLPHEVYKDSVCLKPKQIIQQMEKSVFSQIIEHIKVRMKILQAAKHLNTGTVRNKPPAEQEVTGGNDEEDELSDAEQEEGTSSAVRDERRQQESQEYDGEEQERDLVEDEDDNDLMIGEDTNEASFNEEIQDESITEDSVKQKKMATDVRIQNVKQQSLSICDYSYDRKKSMWCELTLQYGILDSKIDITSLIEGFAKKAVIHQIPGISRAFLVEEKRNMQSVWRLKTEGVNIKEMYKHADFLNINELYTNDIHAFANIYGIEAAAKVLIKEIKNVFGAYGIQVDYRHLSLLADYMTFEGSYKSLNRNAIESNASPFQKMTFETTMNFLAKACLHDGTDFLKSPSSRIVTGRVVGCGTGCFEILQPLVAL